jgi:hypothetical protein
VCRRASVALAVTCALAAPCAAQELATVAKLVDSLTVYVEGSSRLTFRRPPRFAVPGRPQVKAYLQRQLDRPGIADRLRAQTVAYYLFRLAPDTLLHRRERIEAEAALLHGYYDPEADTLFIVSGQPRRDLIEVVSHELVHALQGQRVDLVTLLDRQPDDDARIAAKMIFEGQATFASLRLLAGGRNIVGYTGFWRALVSYMKLDPSIMSR